MTYEDFYGPALTGLTKTKQQICDLISLYSSENPDHAKSVIYCCSRLKTPESMIQKLKKRGLPVNKQAALSQVYDAVGIRVVCSFAEDVYQIAAWLKNRAEFRILEEKDYIAYPKPNGYRSLHLLLQMTEGEGSGLFAEIQIRTIAIDFWAALEHQLKYKKNLPHEAMIREELKRCADEIASVDLSMQTIRDILRESSP